MLRGINPANIAGCNDLYSIMSVELWHLFRLGILKKFEERTVSYLTAQEKEISLPLTKKFCEKLSSRRQ